MFIKIINIRQSVVTPCFVSTQYRTVLYCCISYFLKHCKVCVQLFASLKRCTVSWCRLLPLPNAAESCSAAFQCHAFSLPVPLAIHCRIVKVGLSNAIKFFATPILLFPQVWWTRQKQFQRIWGIRYHFGLVKDIRHCNVWWYRTFHFIVKINKTLKSLYIHLISYASIILVGIDEFFHVYGLCDSKRKADTKRDCLERQKSYSKHGNESLWPPAI